MKTLTIKAAKEFAGLRKAGHGKPIETLMVSSIAHPISKGKKEIEVVLKNGRTKIVSRTTTKQIYTQLLQLNFQLEEYIKSERFETSLSFGYFLNEYIRRQNKLDKHFAIEIGVKHAAISQYLNNRRKPTMEFIIRLELHSNGMFKAINWLKLIQKEKEQEIITDTSLRIEESKYIKNKLHF